MKLRTLASLLVVTTSAAFAGDWQQWRGPDFNGTSPEKNLPSKWSQTEGVKWSLDMPGISGATNGSARPWEQNTTACFGRSPWSVVPLACCIPP